MVKRMAIKPRKPLPVAKLSTPLRVYVARPGQLDVPRAGPYTGAGRRDAVDSNVVFHKGGRLRHVVWRRVDEAPPLPTMVFILSQQFSVSHLAFGSAAGTDGTGVFVDDDGTGYIIFASNPPGEGPCD